MKQKEGIGKIVSSSPWSIASVKKSILFDVLGVMDRANRIRTRRTLQFDYSLLKKETAEKYEELYKVARNRSEWFAAAFYVPRRKYSGERGTVIYSYLMAKAFDWVSYNCLERWLKETGSEAIVYHIAAACLSNEEKAKRENVFIEKFTNIFTEILNMEFDGIVDKNGDDAQAAAE